MLTSSLIAISAAATSIAVTGALVAFRTHGHKLVSLILVTIFCLFSMITSVPLTINFIHHFYVFHMAALLPVLLALPAVIALYVKAQTSDTSVKLFNWRDWVLPLIGFVVMLGYWFLDSDSKRSMLIDGELPVGFFPAALAISTLALLLLWVVSSIVYLVLTLKRLRNYRTLLKHYYSNLGALELVWIDWLMVFLSILWFASAASLVTDNFTTQSLFSAHTNYLITAALLLFLITFISTPAANDLPDLTSLDSSTKKEQRDQSSHYTSSPNPEPKRFPKDTTDDDDKSKYTRSALSDEQAQTIAKRIEQAMSKDDLYLDPNLSLAKLARHVNALPNFVSQTLNEVLKSTFYDYVGYWRVQAAKHLILKGEISILEISLDVGFNSRSSFYTAFKKETGMTPKQFRATNINQ